MTKASKEVIKQVKAWCEKEGHTYKRYECGNRGHDVVHVEVWGIAVKAGVACTPRYGPQAAGKNAVFRLKTKVTRLRQRIVNGTFTHRK